MSDLSTTSACVVLLAFLAGVINASKDLALHKKATQSSTHVRYDAGRAVDGIPGHDEVAGHCSHTDLGHSEAWWMVDLGRTYRIQTINITYRYGYALRLSGYYLYVSNTSFHDISTDLRSQRASLLP
ncbi:fucolectin-5-like [Mizuhopecten yessoensis]|uniref:fucolectin-5-like n=1 Tax=Mizuhopecten yessoensis TaxID=6573 RepID=UPI000B45B4FB|nr:fucolectin-5-like [Mizuhopecten yessoensis]